MFCFQCEQSSKGTGCVTIGICGKEPEVSNQQDELTAALISLAQTVQGNKAATTYSDILMMQGLFTTITNVSFDAQRVEELTEKVKEETVKAGGSTTFPWQTLWEGDTDLVSLRSTLLFGLKGMAAYAWHAYVLGRKDPEVTAWFYKGMAALAEEHSVEEWLSLLMEFGLINLKCMGLLDEANTSTYGHPVPTKVTTKIEKGPFIVVTGHDLHVIFRIK